MKVESHNTNNVSMLIKNGDPSKKAGSNKLQITVESSSWRVPPQTLQMTIREAQALRSFLNKHLG